MKRPDGPRWKEAAASEMTNHWSNCTWELVELPPGAKVIDSKWAFVALNGAICIPLDIKARLVAKGFSQCPGFEYSLC